MTNFLTVAIVWGPSVYYASGIANNLITPWRIKSKSEAAMLAKDFFPDVFQKVEKLRTDILVYNNPGLPYAAVLGANFGQAAVLFTNPDLASTDIYAHRYICKHELSHIYNSDGFTASGIAALVSAISTYAVPYLKSCLPWWASPLSYCVPFVLGSNIFTAIMGIGEIRADRFASQHATNEELKGIARFLKGQIELNIEIQKKYPKFFSTDGNTRWPLGDATHPPLTYRLQEIESELKQRNITIEKTSDSEMEDIRNFHKKAYEKFSKLKFE